MTLRRRDLCSKFYDRNSEIFKSKADAKAAFDDIFAMIETELGNGNDIVLTGFGKFWVSRLKPRKVRNPVTKTTSMGHASTTVRFTVSDVLRDKIGGAGSGE